MDEIDFYKLFKDYGIQYEPLPNNYDPDNYGKQLMMSCQTSEGVIYSAFTSPYSSKNEEGKKEQ